MFTRILLSCLAIPAAIALAAPAHADGLAVNFQPALSGMNVVVTDTTGYPQAQNCTYTAVSAGGLGSLVPPVVERPFQLAPKGTFTLRLPGLATGTVYDTRINCEWDGPPLPTTGTNPTGPRPSAGFNSQTVTY